MSLRNNNSKKKFRNIAIGGLLIAGAALVAVPVTTSSFSATDTGNVKIKSAELNLDLADDHGSTGTFNLDFSNLKPGEVQHQSFYVHNTGTIPAVAKFGQPVSGTDFKGGTNPGLDKLLVGVSGITSLKPATSFSDIGLGSIQPGETKKVTLDIGLDKSAGNEWQGVTMAGTATVTLDQQ